MTMNADPRADARSAIISRPAPVPAEARTNYNPPGPPPKAFRLAAPTVVPFPELQALLDARVRLQGESADLHRQTQQLDALRRQAESEDSAALSEAIKSGGKTPTKLAVTAVDEDRSLVWRRLAATDDLIEQNEREIDDAIEANRAQWIGESAGFERAAMLAYLDAVDAMAEARRAWSEAIVLTKWIAGFPEQPWHVASGMVRQIVSANGSPMYFEAVCEALKADTGPRPDEPRRLHVHGRELGSGTVAEGELVASRGEPREITIERESRMTDAEAGAAAMFRAQSIGRE